MPAGVYGAHNEEDHRWQQRLCQVGDGSQVAFPEFDWSAAVSAIRGEHRAVEDARQETQNASSPATSFPRTFWDPDDRQ
jgi:hypothetical protein